MLGPGEHVIAEPAEMIQSPVYCMSYKGIVSIMLSGRKQLRPHLVVGIVIDLKLGSEIFIAGEEDNAAGDGKQKQQLGDVLEFWRAAIPGKYQCRQVGNFISVLFS